MNTNQKKLELDIILPEKVDFKTMHSTSKIEEYFRRIIFIIYQEFIVVLNLCLEKELRNI